MRRWLIGAASVTGGLVALVGIAAVIGLFLPKNHVATRSARFNRTPDEVFGAVSDFASAPLWRPDVRRVEMLPGDRGLPRYREESGSGTVTFQVEEMAPPRRLAVRIADEGLPFGGRWVYEVESVSDGARLTITEEGEVYNPLFRFMSRFVFGHHSTLEQYLKALGQRFGETVVLESGAATT